MRTIFAFFTFVLCICLTIHAQVGIGTSNPQAELHVAGSKTGIQTLRIDDLAVTTGGTNPGELATSSTTVKKTVYIDESGNLWSSDAYGSSMKSVSLSATTQNIQGATRTDITGATITFIPKHTIVYLSFTISGYNPLDCAESLEQLSWFGVHVIKDAVKVGSFVSLSAASDDITGAVGAANVSAAQFPITVIPGVSTTIKLQGNTDGAEDSCGFTIDAVNWTSYLTIMD
jgi:hypothetical protein